MSINKGVKVTLMKNLNGRAEQQNRCEARLEIIVGSRSICTT